MRVLSDGFSPRISHIKIAFGVRCGISKQTRDGTVWKFNLMVIETKIIPVSGIITVFLNTQNMPVLQT